MVDGEVGWMKPFRAVEGCQYSFPYILLFTPSSLPSSSQIADGSASPNTPSLNVLLCFHTPLHLTLVLPSMRPLRR